MSPVIVTWHRYRMYVERPFRFFSATDIVFVERQLLHNAFEYAESTRTPAAEEEKVSGDLMSRPPSLISQNPHIPYLGLATFREFLPARSRFVCRTSAEQHA